MVTSEVKTAEISNLNDIESILNQNLRDESFLKDFLSGPKEALRRKGIFLNDEIEEAMDESAKGMWRPLEFLQGSNLSENNDFDPFIVHHPGA
jgi:hypothetical protein